VLSTTETSVNWEFCSRNVRSRSSALASVPGALGDVVTRSGFTLVISVERADVDASAVFNEIFKLGVDLPRFQLKVVLVALRRAS